jgi:hypothetical protein
MLLLETILDVSVSKWFSLSVTDVHFFSFFAIKKKRKEPKKRKTTLCLRRLPETTFPNLP